MSPSTILDNALEAFQNEDDGDDDVDSPSKKRPSLAKFKSAAVERENKENL